jgi:hypothetical protein
MRWGIEQRLEFIEFQLYWEGGLNRSDIIDFFGISVPQASSDLAQYRQLEPNNIRYDASQKRYLAAADFKPRFLKPDADRYLNQLRTIADRVVAAPETWLQSAPSTDVVPVPHRQVNTEILRELLAAVRRRRSLEIKYQSMNPKRPDTIWRRISPHAFASDGMRWHVRAYCHVDRKFKDFLLSRCLGARGNYELGAAAEDDALWHDVFEVVLAPNPALSENQQAVVAQDFDMKDGRVSVPVRKALLYYFQKRLRLDVAGTLDGPQETPVVIANREEFAQALAEAMT